MMLLLIIIGLLLVMAGIGWARFAWTKERATMTIETQAIRADCGRLVRGCESWLHEARERWNSWRTGTDPRSGP